MDLKYNIFMEKTCVFTVAIGEKYRAIAALTHQTIEKYANRIGADFVILDTVRNNILSQKWQKMYVYTLLNNYSRIIYMDTDLIVRDDCPNLFDLVPNDSIGLFNEGKYVDRTSSVKEASKVYNEMLDPEWTGKFYNTGVMVISRVHKQLFKPPAYMDEVQCDQPYLNLRIINDKVKVFELPYRFNRMELLDSKIGIHRLASYVVHYAGAPNDIILSIIEKDIAAWSESSDYSRYSKRNVVIVISAGMGDQLCAEPVVRFIREKYFSDPMTEVTVTTHHPRLFEHIPGIKIVKHSDFSMKEATIVLRTTPEDKFNTHGLSHTMFHPTDFASISTVKQTLPLVDKPIKLKVIETAISEVSSIYPGLDLTDLILIHPGKWWPSKTFPVKWWQEIIDRLAKKYKIGLIGKTLSEEQGYQPVVCPENAYDFRDITSLDEMIALISLAKCTLTNDSSPVHIAGAFDNWLVVIPSAKHPDHILPYRMNSEGYISQYYKTKAIYKKLTIDSIETRWTSENPGTIDTYVGNILDFIPKPKEVVSEIMRIFP